MSHTPADAPVRDGAVLLVDPSSMTRRSLSKLLGKHRTVFTADGSESAWRMLEQQRPDCLIVDFGRGAEQDALSLLEMIRNSADDALRSLPIVALGPGEDDAESRALDAGAGAYLAKPFDSGQLLDLLRDSPRSAAPASQAIAPPTALDAVTGLPKDDYFAYRGEKELAFARRYNKNLAVLVFEIDDLATLVEKHGAPLAKQIVRKLAKYIGEATRGEDTVARLGGRRFGVVAPTCDEFGAKAIADRIVSKVRRRVFNYGKGKISFRVSAGLAAPRVSHAGRFQDIAEVALERLRSAVAAGGDRAVFDDRSHQSALSQTRGQRAVNIDDLAEAVDTGLFSAVHTGPFAAVDAGEPAPAPPPAPPARAARSTDGIAVQTVDADGAPSLDVVMWLLENGLGHELEPHYAKLLEQVMPLLERAGANLGDDTQALLQRLRENLRNGGEKPDT